MELTEGQVYQKDKAEKDSRRIVERYREQGFIDADVRSIPKFQPDVNDNRVSVEVAITEGRQFRIGRIEVTGNEKITGQGRAPDPGRIRLYPRPIVQRQARADAGIRNDGSVRAAWGLGGAGPDPA